MSDTRASRAGASSRRVVPRGPELEGQERVELLSMIVTPLRMLGEKPPDRLGAEEPSPADHLRGAHVSEHLCQLPAEPAPQRDAEALIRTLENVTRHTAGKGELEHVCDYAG